MRLTGSSRGGSDRKAGGYEPPSDSDNDCPCCHGDPLNCSTPECAERGQCGCMFGEEFEMQEDDTLCAILICKPVS